MFLALDELRRLGGRKMSEHRLIAIDYMPLSEAVSCITRRNHKLHAIEEMAASFQEYGFVDPPSFEPSLNGGEGGFKHGNGRVEALQLSYERGDAPPRGVKVAEDGEWLVPILRGNAIGDEVAAEAYAIDHNNLTLSGGQFTIEEMARLYDFDEYAEHLEEIYDAGGNLVTVREIDLVVLMEGGEPDLGDFGEIEEINDLIQDEIDAANDRSPSRASVGIGPYHFKIPTTLYLDWEKSIQRVVGFSEARFNQEILERLGV